MSDIDLKIYEEALEWAGVLPIKQLAKYMQLLLDWNQKINLTGAKDPRELAVKHLADVWRAYQAIGQLPAQIGDIGSGGGLPGIALAIMAPNTSVTLVERRQKRAAVLSSIVSNLGLDRRVRIIAKSFEEIQSIQDGTELWFRGFLPGPKLAVYLSEHFPRGDLGQLVLMKGPAWPQEKLSLMSTPRVKEVWMERFAGAAEISYSLPHEAGERVLILV